MNPDDKRSQIGEQQEKAMGCLVVGLMKGLGLLIGLTILVSFIFLVTMGLRGCLTRPYWKGKRALKENPCKAAALFAEAIRDDARSTSHKSQLILMEMMELCALEELIGLIDLPDLEWIPSRNRVQMCDVIRKRTAGTTADKLPLDSHAAQEVRARQRREWEKWFAKAKEQYEWVEGRFVPNQTQTHPAPA